MDYQLIRAYCAKDLNGILKPGDKWYSTPYSRFEELECQILFKHRTGARCLEPRQYAAAVCLRALEILEMPFQADDDYPEFTQANSEEAARQSLADTLAAYVLHLSVSEAAPLLPMNAELQQFKLSVIPQQTAPATDTAKPAPVVTDRRKEKKPSIESVALDYMRKTYKAAHFQSATKFHRHLIKTAGVADSPFQMGTGDNARKLFCPAASSFYDASTLGKIWAKIRAG